MANRGPACHPGGVRSEGPEDAALMIVSIGPGFQELKEGRPFVGESGKLLSAILRAVGFTREQVYLANVCCDHLGEEEADASRCLQRLREEIMTVKPRLIIPLGAFATEMMTADWYNNRTDDGEDDFWFIRAPGRTVGKTRGQPLWYDNVIHSGHSCRIMPTWQPAAALREGGSGYLSDIIRDFSKLMPYPFPDVLSWPRDHGKFDWQLVDTTEKAVDVLTLLRPEFPVAIDIETGNSGNIEEMSMDVYREQLLCFAIAQRQYDGTTQSYTFTPETYGAFVRWFNYADLGQRFDWLTHYGFFDKQGILQMLGLNIPIKRDTLSGSHCLDERPGLHKLKTLAREYTGADFWEAFIEQDFATMRSRDKFLARLKPQDSWPADDMQNSDLELFMSGLDENGRVKQELCASALWDFWQLYKANWHHSRATMKKLPEFLEAYELRLLEIEAYGFEKLDRDKLYKYNGEDAARTAQLDYVEQPMLEDDGTLEVYNLISIPDMNVNAEMAYAGIPIDLDVRDQLKAEWEPIRDRMEADLQAYAQELGYENDDGSPINLGSWKQKGKLFYDILKLELPNVKGAKTKSGQPSTNIKVLEEMKDQTDFIPRMIAWSHANHQLNAYIEPMPVFVREGSIHPTWKPHGTRTHRDSYADPALHQLPKYVAFDAEPEFEGDDPFHAGKDALRKMFVAWHQQKNGAIDKDGYIFVEVDLKSAEQYCNAYLSSDEEYLSDIRSGDLHRAAAARLYNIPLDEVDGKQRRDGKTVNFGVAYGIQAFALGQLLKKNTSEAQAMLDAWWRGYGKFWAKTKEWKAQALKTGRIVAPSGRVRHLGLIIGEDSYHELNQAMNFPGQCTVSEYIKMSRLQLHLGSQARQCAAHMYTQPMISTAALAEYDSRILFNVHDSLNFLVNIDHFQAVIGIIHTVMTQGYFDLPGIPVDIQAGPSWGEVRPVTQVKGVWTLE